jgi:hypothetical protein
MEPQMNADKRRLRNSMFVLVVLAALGAAPAPSVIHIVGSAVKTSDWSVDQLQTQLAKQIKAVDYNSKGR